MDQSNERHRLKALYYCELLDTLPDEEFDRITQLATTIFKVPVSFISLIDSHRQWFKSKQGLTMQDTNREFAFCNFTIQQNGLLEVENAILDERFCRHPWVINEPNIRYYAGYPLIDKDGYAIGSFCIGDQQPRKLTEDQRISFSLLAESVMSLINNHKGKNEALQFEKLFNVSSDFVCVISQEGNLKKANPSFREALGITGQQLSLFSFYDFIHPDDLKSTYGIIHNAVPGKQALSFTIKLKVRSYEYRTIQWTASIDNSTYDLYAIGRDFTEEKVRETILKDSESKFRLFFENSLGHMCTHDLTGKLLTVNHSGAVTLGYTPGELIGKSLYDIIPGEFHSGVAGYLDQICRKGKMSGLMFTQHKDGSRRTWLYGNILITDAQGQQYAVCNAIDVTERHKLEADLKRAKEILEHTNQAARIGSWEVDAYEKTIYWSDITKQIHEVPEAFNPTFDNVTNFFQDDDLKIVNERFEMAFSNGCPIDMEVKMFTGKGNHLWIRIIGKPELANKKCKRIYGIVQDINEKKNVEYALLREKSMLAAFVEHAPAAVAMFDNDLRYLAVTKQWLEDNRLGEQQLIGKLHYHVVPTISDRWKAIHQKCLAGAVEYCEEDVWRRPGSDADQYLRWGVRPWYKFDGAIGGIMMMTQDITEAALQKIELKRAKMLAEQASVAKSYFLANMSHELRTPLNGIIGFTDLVLKTPLSVTQSQYLTLVNQSANLLLNIINDILDFSKIESGKLELYPEKCDLYELLYESANLIAYPAQKKGLEVLLNVSPFLPEYIQVDSLRVKQVLTNLLSNAVKFTECGEIVLAVDSVRINGKSSTQIRFEVRDTGIGIKREHRKKIFESFTQADPGATKKYGGTGLGLTISNLLLGLMNSHLQLHSRPGKGSTFSFVLNVPERGEPPKELLKNFGAISVLIIDDNLSNRLIVKKMLTLKNIESEEAATGAEAIEIFEKKQFDIILIDYGMQPIDGIEFARNIRGKFGLKGKTVKIIMLLNLLEIEQFLHLSKDVDINNYLTKPIKIKDLYLSIEKVQNIKEFNALTPVSKDVILSDIKLKILVVEDNSVNKLFTRSILVRILPAAIIYEASNGKQAIEICQSILPDLILMDVQMPEMNGYEATRKIRKIEPLEGVPIIALTADNLKGNMEKCLKAGMNDLLVKPFVAGDLRSLLGKWIQKKEIEKAAPHKMKIRNIHFDISAVRECVGTNKIAERQLLSMVAEDLLAFKNVFRQLIVTKNLAGVSAMKHKMLGTCSSAGLSELKRLISQFKIGKPTDFEESEAAEQMIIDEINTALKVIRRYLKVKVSH